MSQLDQADLAKPYFPLVHDCAVELVYDLRNNEELEGKLNESYEVLERALGYRNHLNAEILRETGDSGALSKELIEGLNGYYLDSLDEEFDQISGDLISDIWDITGFRPDRSSRRESIERLNRDDIYGDSFSDIVEKYFHDE